MPLKLFLKGPLNDTFKETYKEKHTKNLDWPSFFGISDVLKGSSSLSLYARDAKYLLKLQGWCHNDLHGGKWHLNLVLKGPSNVSLQEFISGERASSLSWCWHEAVCLQGMVVWSIWQALGLWMVQSYGEVPLECPANCHLSLVYSKGAWHSLPAPYSETLCY